MILVDTSAWVHHLRSTDLNLVELLDHGQVLVHPFVIGELALGNLGRRRFILDNLRGLPHAAVAGTDEVLDFIEGQELYELGIGYVDAHLLAATRLTGGTALWTRDRRLRMAADRLGLGARV